MKDNTLADMREPGFLEALARRQELNSAAKIDQTIHITSEITLAYRDFLNQSVDSDMAGTPILRRSTPPYNQSAFAGIVDFAAGWQMCKQKEKGTAP